MPLASPNFIYGECMRALDAFERSQKKLFRAIQKELKHLDEAKDRYLRAYEKSYKQSLRIIPQASKRENLLRAAASARVVLVGDFHPFRQSQKGFLRLLRDTVLRSERSPVIAMECIQRRYQNALDHYSAGRITAEELREEVDFERHWPFAWESYKEIFEFARAQKMPILALNIEPVPGSRGALHLRDQAAAATITTFAEEHPGAQIFALYGELHLAAPHLPKKISEILPGRVLVVHQNEPDLFWASPRGRSGERPEVLRLRANEFCVLNSVPWIKLRSYLDWAEGSAEDDWEDGTDVTGAVVHFAGMLAELLELDSPSADALNVYAPEQMEDPLPRSASPVERAIYAHSKERARISFLPRSNILLVPSLSTNALTEGGSLLLWATHNHSRVQTALGLRLLVQFMVGYLGSKLLNPKRKCNEEADMARFLAANSASRDPKSQVFARALAILAKVLRGEKISSQPLPAKKEVEAIRLAGYVLGNRLFFSWRRKASSADLVRSVFTTSVSSEVWAQKLLARVKREIAEVKKLPPGKHESF
jgi:hypothetical protein